MTFPVVPAPISAASPPNSALPNSLDRRYADFSAQVMSRGGEGAAYNSALGWGLFVLATLDALLNARGQGGALSTAFANWAVRIGLIGSRGSSASILILVLQVLLLSVAAVYLRRSPWRRYLRTSLRGAWPGQWLPEMLVQRNVAAGVRQIQIDRTQAVMIVRDIGLFCVSLYLISPLLAGLEPFLRIPFLLMTAYALVMLVSAVAAHVPRDTGTMIGIGIGGVAVPVFASMVFRGATVPPTWLSAPDSSFQAVQSFVFILAVFLVWSLSVGSMVGQDLLRLELGEGSGPITFDIPDATTGAFSPTFFEVVPNGRKVALLSRPAQGSTAYTVHTTQDRYSLNERRWTLLDLTEIERRIGQSDATTGRVSVVRKGVAKFLTSEVDINVKTLTPEAIFTQQLNEVLRRGIAQMEVGEFAHFNDMMLSGGGGVSSAGMISDAIAEDVGSIVDAELDVAWAPALARTARVASLNQVFDSVQAAVKNYEYRCGTELAKFSALCSDVTSINRRDEIDVAMREASRNINEARDRLEETYALVRQCDAINVNMRSNLTAKLKDLERVFKLRSGSARQASPGTPIYLNLFDFIRLTPGEVRVELASEAADELKRVKETYEKFDQAFYWAQLREIQANNGAAINAHIANLVALGYPGVREAGRIMNTTPQGPALPSGNTSRVRVLPPTSSEPATPPRSRVRRLTAPVESGAKTPQNPFQD